MQDLEENREKIHHLIRLETKIFQTASCTRIFQHHCGNETDHNPSEDGKEQRKRGERGHGGEGNREIVMDKEIS